MKVLVVYGTRYGATRGIAERIGRTLGACGHEVEVAEATGALDARPYDAFVIGSAAYQGSWLEGPVDFVVRHVDLLAERPVWLFSSGPLGTEATDEQGRDQLEITRPRQFDELGKAVLPRGTQVFYGALDPEQLRMVDRIIRRLPTGHRLLPEGDFRDWAAIDAWAKEIGAELPGGTPPATTS
jgi:menaquinone-dependent protoporphyrinogen oxidase